MIISLVLPCYNPPQGWAQTIRESYSTFCARLQDKDTELIIVMDGISSTVNEADVQYIEQHIAGVHIIRYDENRGKGYAIRQGVAIARGDLILYTDIDFPYTADSVHAIYQALRNDEADVAVGVKNEAYYAHVPALRRAISRYLRFLIRMFLSMPVTDTQCGLKGFKRAVMPLFMQTTIDRYLFDLEFIRNCFRSKKYRVKAIPITLNDNVQFRSMNYRILLPEMLNFAKLLFNKNK